MGSHVSDCVLWDHVTFHGISPAEVFPALTLCEDGPLFFDPGGSNAELTKFVCFLLIALVRPTSVVCIRFCCCF